jgi:hypothetical protein
MGRISKKKEIDTAMAETIVAQHQKENSFSIEPFCLRDIEYTIAHSKNSPPGPDGLPFLALAVAGNEGAWTLFLALVELLKGSLPTPDLHFNMSCVVSPRKETTMETL